VVSSFNFLLWNRWGGKKRKKKKRLDCPKMLFCVPKAPVSGDERFIFERHLEKKEKRTSIRKEPNVIRKASEEKDIRENFLPHG